jgi:hypothetical protein
MVAVPSELLGPDERVSQVDKEPRGNEAGQRIVEDHGGYPQSRSQAWTYAIDSTKKTSPTASMTTSIMGMFPTFRFYSRQQRSAGGGAVLTGVKKAHEFLTFTSD